MTFKLGDLVRNTRGKKGIIRGITYMPPAGAPRRSTVWQVLYLEAGPDGKELRTYNTAEQWLTLLTDTATQPD
jgi:hypothetical protein